MEDDVLVSLTQDHMVLSQLADLIRKTPERVSRNALFDQLAKALGGHFSALEYVVVPALSRAGTRGLGVEVLIAHMNLKRRLADLLMMERRNARFEAEMLRFCDETEAQAEREQLELLPVLRLNLSETDRAHLAADVEAQMASRLGDHPLMHMARVQELRAAVDLLQEAEVVLGGLQRK